MDVSFDNQRCAIPFILIQMDKLEKTQPVDHDGKSHIRINSSTPIECIGDAQVLSYIYPQEIGVGNVDKVVNGSEDLSRDFQKLRHYLPFPEF